MTGEGGQLLEEHTAIAQKAMADSPPAFI